MTGRQRASTSFPPTKAIRQRLAQQARDDVGRGHGDDAVLRVDADDAVGLADRLAGDDGAVLEGKEFLRGERRRRRQKHRDRDVRSQCKKIPTPALQHNAPPQRDSSLVA